LQTGAYGAPTPTLLAISPNTAAGPAGVDQPTYAQLLDNIQRLDAQVQTLSGANQDFYNSGGDGEGIEGDPNSSGFSFSGFGFGPDPSQGAWALQEWVLVVMVLVMSHRGAWALHGGAPSGDGPGDDDGTGSPAGHFEVGGLIRMAEGGEAH
jgi:hypothetical protein